MNENDIYAAQNMYDAWDNGDRHAIRQQFANREAVITAKRTEHVATIKSFDTFDEADAYRKKFAHADLYGLYGMWQSSEKQLWTPMPLSVLKAMMEFKEPRND